MKAVKILGIFCSVIFAFAATTGASAQQTAPAPEEKKVEITKSETKTEAPAVEPEKTPPPAQSQTPDAGKVLPEDVPDSIKQNRRGQLSEEEAAIVPYYNNFLTNYYLGPEDVISVEVFAQPNYSKTGITIPPNGRISYPLIREGIIVNGKTVEQVADEITKKLDEYIIDPKVMVSLDRAVSARYSVLGDVGKPGVYIMTRRVSVHEAIAEASGILVTGNKKEVIVLRRGQDGRPSPIAVNLQDIERGKAREEVFLVPGDQIIVPGNKIKVWKNVMNLLPIIGFARMFTGF
ncbi:MAG TPA: polysaccharide biosynthesis/export family protein [Pyrinomonadaceae bacterium]|jgi:polysaccharide export outer membrane protein